MEVLNNQQHHHLHHHSQRPECPVAIHGRMSLPLENAVEGDELSLGEPVVRIVAYEYPNKEWMEVIYV